jgi:acetyltransferase-like isoleucine patch superfamily enzyme
MEQALVSDRAKLGNNVTVGPYTIVHDNVEIGDDSIIESHCIIGNPARSAEGPLVIGEGSHIRSHSVVYEGSTFGPHFVTGHGVLVREHVTAGRYLQVGSRSEIQGPSRIGDYVKMHSDVQLAEAVEIGNFVWLFPKAHFPTDPFPPSAIRAPIRIADLAVIGVGAVIMGGVNVGLGGFVSANSLVRKDVPDIHCVNGNPARVFATLDQLANFEYGLTSPWPKHFREGYPEESMPLLDEIQERVERAIAEHRKRGRA